MASLPQAKTRATPPGNRSALPRAREFSPLERETEAALDLIRPAIREDGGNVELTEVRPDGTAVIRWQGACIGCPSSEMTLRDGIERHLVERVAGVTGVEAIEG